MTYSLHPYTSFLFPISGYILSILLQETSVIYLSITLTAMFLVQDTYKNLQVCLYVITLVLSSSFVFTFCLKWYTNARLFILLLCVKLFTVYSLLQGQSKGLTTDLFGCFTLWLHPPLHPHLVACYLSISLLQLHGLLPVSQTSHHPFPL